MKLYEWMVKFTPQTEWIEGRGMLMWLAEVASGMGAGLFLISLFLDNLLGMFIGWIIVIVLKGGLHILYLGKPLRFWRMMMKPGTSWMSRGFIFMGLFIIFGAILMASSYLQLGSGLETTFAVLSGITAFLLAIYTGFVLNYVNGIPFWNSALLPLLLVLTGALDGGGLTIAMGIFGASVDLEAAETISRILLFSSAIVIGVYLWSSAYTGAAGKQSVTELVRGSLAPVLWLGVVTLGIIVPVIISGITYYSGEATSGLLLLGVACETVGAFTLKYSILKAGIYAPLIPSSAT